MDVTRVFDLLPFQLQKFAQSDAFAMKVNKEWTTYSTEQIMTLSDQVGIALIALGVGKEDKVAIISHNRVEWNIVDYGIQKIGAVGVPMYPTITVDDYRYIFNDAGVKVVFVSSLELYNKVALATEGISGSMAIYTFDHITGAAHWQSLLKPVSDDAKLELQQRMSAVLPEDLLTLIYTSGTTGNPKGVMLTHNNLVTNFKSAALLMPVNETHRALSFLPLCHVYERMLNYLYVFCGVSVYYAESLETISDNLKEIKPHIFVTVPRLLEKVYDKIYAKGAALTGIKKFLFFWALKLGLRYKVGSDLGFIYRTQLKLANKLIFNKWREALGGNIKAVVSGGAALQPRLAQVFWAAQIPILEGYGLTETSPVISVNRAHESENRVSTVGPAIQGVEIKIAEDGEILTRGPHVMKGYYQKPELTAMAIDTDGWFHTGDIGTFVEGKFLKITDRKKEIFKTSGGKYIAPQIMENKFKESPFIEQIMIVGEGQKFPSALIVPAFAYLKDYCAHKEIKYTTDQQMIKHPEVVAKFEREIEDKNTCFAQYEKVKKFALLATLWSVDGGELTPKLSLKRKVIEQKNLKDIEFLYQ